MHRSAPLNVDPLDELADLAATLEGVKRGRIEIVTGGPSGRIVVLAEDGAPLPQRLRPLARHLSLPGTSRLVHVDLATAAADALLHVARARHHDRDCRVSEAQRALDAAVKERADAAALRDRLEALRGEGFARAQPPPEG